MLNRDAQRGSSDAAISADALTTRYHYMDNLRALAMLGGVVFHAALSYSPLLGNLWPTASSDNSTLIDIAAWFSHLFRMPLFFLIAGFFACYLLHKRDMASLFKNRALRILLPFVIFLPLLWTAFAVSFGWAMENVSNPSPLLGLMKMGAAMPEPPPPPTPTTTHLWFLYNLIQFYLVYAVLEWSGAMRSRVASVLTSLPFLLVVMPVLVALALVGHYPPHPAPEQFTPQLWSFGFYGLFFLVGVQFFRDQSLIDRLARWSPMLLIVALGAYAWWFPGLPETIYFMEAMSRMEGVEFSAGQFGQSLLQGLVAVYMTLVCLIAGKLLLDRANAVVRFVADSSYWLYIIHLPLLFFIQFLLLDVDWGMWVEFAVATVGTIVIGLITYAVLVRHMPIGWLLNGRKRKASPPAPAAVTGP
ncbi:MAG: acyltransferase family protein [Pseudomonadota bacterium]